MPEVMESADEITSILETFCESRSALSASTSTIKRGPYTSYVLDVDTKGMYIDQLIPNSGNYLIQPGQVIDLITNCGGVDYVFKSLHISRGVDDAGFPYHHLSLPTEVNYSEKRSEYRITIKRDEHPIFHLADDSGESYLAALENISNCGARLRLRAPRSPLVTDSCVYCEFDLVERGSLSCHAVIRNQRQLSNTQEVVIGIEFLEMPDATIRELQKTLMVQQRRNIRTYLPS